MPGGRLNDDERSLKQMWLNHAQYPRSQLTGISITGQPGLRGITDLSIDFRYPITVICGKNGCGKTTVLALAALAFHPPKGHYCRQAKRGQDRGYYTFGDFFFKGHGDPDISGLEIEWRFSDPNVQRKRIKKQSAKWMRYDSRPERPVHYVGASRIVPAVELSVLRQHFRGGVRFSSTRARVEQLNSEFKDKLSRVLGRSYSEAGQMKSGRYAIRRCTYRSAYSSFNMGAGEDTLIDLFYLLQETPNGSLIVIEEIELGLHPQAQIELAQELVKLARSKQFQIITSSHSEPFIDHLPRDARILLEFTGSSHQVTYGPTTRFALAHITGKSLTEMKVYCEDPFAAELLTRIVQGPDRERIQVVPIGGWTQVIEQFEAHRRGQFKERCFLIVDGDVENAKICKELKKLKYCNTTSEHNCNPSSGCEQGYWTKLPGSTSPEKWVLTKLIENADYFKSFAHGLKYETDEDMDRLKGVLEEVRAAADTHDIVYELSIRLNVSQEYVAREMTAAVQQSEECVQLANEIRKVLNVGTSG